MDAKADPTNTVLIETIELLEEQEAPIWTEVAENLEKSTGRDLKSTSPISKEILKKAIP